MQKKRLKKYLINTGRYDEDIASLIQYELIHCLIKISDKYLVTIMVSKKILKMSAQKTPIQKYEINLGQDSLDIDFVGANRQFDWIGLSLV